jgi:RNA polymerase sigma-B factor
MRRSTPVRAERGGVGRLAGAERDTLILRHTRLVRAIARRYTGRGFALEDIVQSGYLGLIQAVDRFDPGRGVPLERYAARMIEGEIMHLFRDRGWSVRVPRALQELSGKLAPASEQLTQTLGRAPTVEELAELLGESPDQVEEAMLARRAYAAESLSTTSQAEDGSPVERGPAARVLSVSDDGFPNVEDRDQLRRAMRRLPQRQRTIVRLRFEGDLTQAEIAERLGISQMHVSRLLRGALTTLRGALEAA